MKRREYFSTKITEVLTYLFVCLPLFIFFVPELKDIFYIVSESPTVIISAIVNIVNIILCIYCLIRTFVANITNVFLPKIIMPRNSKLRMITMFLLGVGIAYISSIFGLILWSITCILGMTSNSFVETYSSNAN